MRPIITCSVAMLAMAIVILAVLTGCDGAPQRTEPKRQTVGSIERRSPAIDWLITKTAEIELLAEGFAWSEGPVWIAKDKALLFTDVPGNSIHRWQADKPVTVFLKPSGYTGSKPRGGEPGANGLTLDAQGRLVMCQHGDRRIARLEADGKTITTLADRYDGKRFNSPNDLVYASNGDLYFTDPPYGLEGRMEDPAKEIPFQGVFRLTATGKLSLVTKELSRPNGIALSPDERTLYVANSDPEKAIWMAYPRNPDGSIGDGKLFFDATPLVKSGLKGLPDGMKVDQRGNLFATGPGGVLVFSPNAVHLGTIATSVPTANCAWGDDGSTLYITANHWLCRIRLTTKGF